jgi:SAM-dependent methyltransferase
MQEILLEIKGCLSALAKIVLSAPGEKSPSLSEKILLVKAINKDGSPLFRAEEFRGNKTFHQSLSENQILSFIEEKCKENRFRQINLFTREQEISFRISKKGKVAKSINRKGGIAPQVREGHNREKNYLIREGQAVPFMVDLGVFTREYKVVASKYDKFRQINRFIELVDHAFSDYEKDEIHILDFGCGKSYLTFFIYYYFGILKKKRVHITGYDIKEDVVENCNTLAKKYGYHGLEFVVADVTRDKLSREKIDFVISLHACDVATDFALNFALEHQVPYIFSVPCCQHEIGASIQKGKGDLDLFLSHGLFKERISALLTDAFRAEILAIEGYRVDVLEFVDFAHSPKNLMLRAKRKEKIKKGSFQPLFEMEKKYSFEQTLLHLRAKEGNDGSV